MVVVSAKTNPAFRSRSVVVGLSYMFVESTLVVFLFCTTLSPLQVHGQSRTNTPLHTTQQSICCPCAYVVRILAGLPTLSSNLLSPVTLHPVVSHG